TLFSVLLGTGVGSILSRRIGDDRLPRATRLALVAIAGIALLGIFVLPPVIRWAIPFSHEVRILLTVLLIAPAGVVMGLPLPSGIRLMSRGQAALIPWAWGMNGALS